MVTGNLGLFLAGSLSESSYKCTNMYKFDSGCIFFQQLHTKSFELTKVIHLLEDPLTVSEILLFNLTECFTFTVLIDFYLS